MRALLDAKANVDASGAPNPAELDPRTEPSRSSGYSRSPPWGRQDCACCRRLTRPSGPAIGADLVRASALHKAVAHGDTRSCRLLLWRGADHSKPNLYGDQPLHRAVQASDPFSLRAGVSVLADTHS